MVIHNLLVGKFNQLIQIFQYLHKQNSFLLIQAIFAGANSLLVVFLVCELGQRASDSFTKISYTIDEFDWHLFPYEIQKLLPTILIVTQKLVAQECFGSILCSRNTFKKVRIFIFFINIYFRSDQLINLLYSYFCSLSIELIHSIWYFNNSAIEYNSIISIKNSAMFS